MCCPLVAVDLSVLESVAHCSRAERFHRADSAISALLSALAAVRPCHFRQTSEPHICLLFSVTSETDCVSAAPPHMPSISCRRRLNDLSASMRRLAGGRGPTTSTATSCPISSTAAACGPTSWSAWRGWSTTGAHAAIASWATKCASALCSHLLLQHAA